MGHYNLYETLQLDPSLPTERIADVLKERLAQTPTDNAPLQDLLSTSLLILGTPTRRSLYDAELHNPNIPDITISRLHDIAAMPAPAPESQPAQPLPTEPAMPTPNAWSGTPQNQGLPTPAPYPPQGYAPQAQNYGAAPYVNFQNQKAPTQWTFAVDEHRTRETSLMWIIGYVLILLPWLYLAITWINLSGDDSSKTYLIWNIDDVADIPDVQKFCRILFFSCCNTVVMHAILNLVWYIRRYVGSRSNQQPK